MTRLDNDTGGAGRRYTFVPNERALGQSKAVSVESGVNSHDYEQPKCFNIVPDCTKSFWSDLMSRGEVPVEPFRNEFIRQYNKDQLSLVDLAEALGRKRTDTSSVQRVLGLRPYKAFKVGKQTYNKGGESNTIAMMTPKEAQSGWRYQVKVDYDTAVKLCEVLQMDPTDAGV